MPETVVRGRGRRGAAAGVLLTLAGALALAACTSGPATPSSAPVAVTTLSPTASASATASATPTVERSFLSGRVGAPNGPVLVVKMDNTPASEPHAGIKYADVVYLEQVEGGLSRYAVVFSSQIPKAVGPVRSARIADIELLRQYGKVAFAYSGAQSLMLPVLAAADLYNVSDDNGGAGYYRVSSRPSPENLFGIPRELFQRAPHAAHAVDIGFRFSDQVPTGGAPAAQVSASYPATRVTFTWDASSGRWLAAMNGRRAMAAEGGQLGGTTVIIQYVTLSRSIYRDVLGHYTPMSTTVGTGNALILRNGQAWHATWSRPNQTVGTHWLVGGRDFPLAPGQVWVLLINKTTPATIG
jgi:Protein of unknown function (DUF3048) N-terminal domain/Protein of unknown function (DUF3048) C-terminal domain